VIRRCKKEGGGCLPSPCGRNKNRRGSRSREKKSLPAATGEGAGTDTLRSEKNSRDLSKRSTMREKGALFENHNQKEKGEKEGTVRFPARFNRERAGRESTPTSPYNNHEGRRHHFLRKQKRKGGKKGGEGHRGRRPVYPEKAKKVRASHLQLHKGRRKKATAGRAQPDKQKNKEKKERNHQARPLPLLLKEGKQRMLVTEKRATPRAAR